MSAERRAMWWVVASAASYSMFTVFSEWVLDGLDPTDVLLWRFAIAAPSAWALVLGRRMLRRRSTASPPAASTPARPFLLAGALFGVVALLAFGALEHMSAALYIVVIYTYPAMVAAGSAALGRTPPSRVWIAIGVTLLGIALTVPEVFDHQDADGLGLLLTLGNALAYALYVLGTGRLIGGTAAEPVDGLTASAFSFTGSLLFACAVVPFAGGVTIPDDVGTWFGLVGLGVVSTVVAGATLFVGMRRLPPASAALVASLEPVLTLLWAMTILDESLVALQFVGAALVIAGVVWSQRADPSQPVVAPEPG